MNTINIDFLLKQGLINKKKKTMREKKPIKKINERRLMYSN